MDKMELVGVVQEQVLGGGGLISAFYKDYCTLSLDSNVTALGGKERRLVEWSWWYWGEGIN